jgi:hypothetical protein
MRWRPLIKEVISGICRLDTLRPRSFSESSTRCGDMLSWRSGLFALGILLMLDRFKVVETREVPLRVIVVFLIWIRLPVRLAWLLGSHPSFQLYLPIKPLFLRAHYGIRPSWARHSQSVFLFLSIIGVVLIHQLVLVDFCGIIKIAKAMARGTLIVQSLEIWGLMAPSAILSSIVHKLREVLRVVRQWIADIWISECMLVKDRSAVGM